LKYADIRILRVSLVVLAACTLLAGCRRQEEFVYTRTIPEGASPVYAWRGSRNDIVSYWKDRAVTISAKAHFPEGWKQPGDGYWNVTGTTDKGRPIPFIGVLLWQPTVEGTRRPMIVPGFDINKVADGLYCFIEPNVTVANGKITCIEPVAYVCEIRDHMFKPFRPKVPLVPEEESPLTPAPELPPPAPEGTPIPMD